MKVTENGRKNLPELNEMFDKVLIRYYNNTVVDKQGNDKETVKTMVILVSSNIVHVGVSKWSNRGFQYSKTKGRAMAMGRAEIAFNNYEKSERQRDAHHTGLDPLAYTAVITGEPTVRNILESLVAVEELNKDLV